MKDSLTLATIPWDTGESKGKKMTHLDVLDIIPLSWMLLHPNPIKEIQENVKGGLTEQHSPFIWKKPGSTLIIFISPCMTFISHSSHLYLSVSLSASLLLSSVSLLSSITPYVSVSDVMSVGELHISKKEEGC